MASQINPIVVDLDGTLIKTDMLFESANQFVTENPLRFWQPLAWLMQGRPYLKEQLAQRYRFGSIAEMALIRELMLDKIMKGKLKSQMQGF